MARKVKLNENHINALQEVLFEGLNAVIMTDEELFDAMNERVEKEDKLSYRTFQRYVKKVREGKFDKLGDFGDEFCRLRKKALREQKKALFKKFENSDKWQKYAWIIERKFEDWNLKKKKEVEHSGGISLTQLSEKADQLEDEG